MGWILLLQIMELISIYTKTLVLTGWRIVPWSMLTYFLTFLFAFMADRFFRKVIRDEIIFKRD
jgi:hypothetical protein